MKIDISLDNTDSNVVLVTVECSDSKHWGHDATLTLTAHAEVRDGRAIHDQAYVLTRRLVMGPEPQKISIPRHEMSVPTEKSYTRRLFRGPKASGTLVLNENDLPPHEYCVYTYKGLHLDVNLHAQLQVNKFVVFDTPVTCDFSHPLAGSGPPAGSAHLVKPKDIFLFWDNWLAVPFHNRVALLLLAAAMAVIGVLNTGIGIHDTIVPERKAILYSSRDSDDSPLEMVLTVNAFIAGAIWLAMRGHLRKYMTFTANARPVIQRDSKVRVGDLFRGRSRVPLHNSVLRIVACNMEKGQYKRGSGSSERTVTFCEPVRAVVLYEKRVGKIPARHRVEDYFREDVSFTPAFEMLCPPNKVSATHGVEIYWGILLLNSRYVDQEIVGSLAGLNTEDFFTHALEARSKDAP